MTDSSFYRPTLVKNSKGSWVFGLFEWMKLSDVWLVRTLLLLGVLLRLRQYLFNRSLWLDESLLTLNLLSRSAPELLKPLDYHQGAPLGFLMLEKAAISFLGTSEMALRLIPFLAGIASLFLLAQVAKRFLTSTAVPVAVGLFAISGPLIYYSSEVKQYSTDVCVVLALFLLADSLLRSPSSLFRMCLAAFLAGASIWFSQPAAFVAASIGIVWLCAAVGKRHLAALNRALAFGLITSASFGLSYFVSLRKLARDEWLLGYWNGAFVPTPLFSPAALRWFITTWLMLLEDPMGLTFVGIASVAIIIGAREMFREKREHLLVLVLPVFLALVASGFHRYPFRGRLLLFAVPSILLVAAAGLATIRFNTRSVVPGLGAWLIGLLFFVPAEEALRNVVNPRGVEEIRPVLQYVEQHRQLGDTLFCYYDGAPALKYYSRRGIITSIPTIIGKPSRQDWTAYRQDLNQLRGKRRIWVIFSHIYRDGGADEEKLFLDYLDQLGDRQEQTQAVGASAYLYLLNEPKVNLGE
jgi:hypothetical protein